MSPSKVSSIVWDSFHNTVDGEARGGKEKHYGVNPSTGDKLWPVPIGMMGAVGILGSIAC